MNHRKSPPFFLAALTLITLLFISCACPGTIVNIFIPTRTPTHTATPTSTLTPTPTITPTSTNTPTITPTALPDLSQVTLTLNDLPSGFEIVPKNDCGISKETLDIDGIDAESVCFLDAKHFETIIGFAVLLPTRLMQSEFDARVRQPEAREAITKGLGEGFEILEQKDLPIQQDVGDASVGFTLLFDDGGVPTRMDMMFFRRGEVGVTICLVYINRESPVITIDEVARKMDARIIQVFSGGEMEQQSTLLKTQRYPKLFS
jgi:hypothetical protein